MNFDLMEQALRIQYPGSRVEVGELAAVIEWEALSDHFTVRGFSTESEARAVHEIVRVVDDWLARKLMVKFRPVEDAAQKFIEDAERWRDLVTS